MNPYVIIGNGVAAVGCIEGIRKADPETKIILISAEPWPTYCRPLISYYLEGKTDLDRISYRPSDFYSANNVETRYGTRVTKLDPDAKTVTLEDGSVLAYSKVCLATGSSPFVPPFKGLDTVPEYFGFMTLDDTLALEKAITPESRVLIVGAGLIGLKCAEGLHGRVAEITVCDLADRVLSSILDPECASMVQSHLEANGLRFMLGDSVDAFNGTVATMKSGRTVSFDILVMAVGVRANTVLFTEAGGIAGRGIPVSPRSETALPDVFAAGDCTESLDISSGRTAVLALLPNAFMQGRAAGVNMAGGTEVFDKAIPMNSIGFFGLHIMTAGARDGEMTEIREGDTLKRFFTSDGLLKGFMLIGALDRAGLYTSLIRDRVPLETLDFEAMTKVASSLCFSPEFRKKKFGSVI